MSYVRRINCNVCEVVNFFESFSQKYTSISENVALLTKEDFNPIELYTAIEWPVRIQYKYLVPIYVLPEMTISAQNLTQRRYGTQFSAARLYWGEYMQYFYPGKNSNPNLYKLMPLSL
jgi:hypothetical protein